MKSNSKSALMIKYLFIPVTLLFILGITLKLLNNDIIEIAKNENYINIINENVNTENKIDTENLTKVADVFTRAATITSRASSSRTNANTVNLTDQNATNENTISENSTENSDTTKNLNTTIETVSEEVKYKSVDEITISRNMDLTETCGVSKADFKELLKNTKKDTSGFFYDNSDLIYDLCQEYQLNEVFFCGLIAGESGWNIASNHRNKYNYISMMSNGSLIRYSSVEDGLESAAKLLHNKYLTPGGSCYSGKTLAGVQKRFCPNSTTWVNLIYTCMSQML